MKLLYACIAVAVMVFLSPQEQSNFSEENHGQVGTDSAMSAQEWKRFKEFTATLDASQAHEQKKEIGLKNYTRDSLRILEVKLLAIKILEERRLLMQDIVENTSYYQELLEELQESSIAPVDYLFFERQMHAFVRQDLELKAQRRTWMILGLLLLSIFLGTLLFKKRKSRSIPLPELSKQEATIRTLIVQGKSNKEIANELFISLSTVKSHITNIYTKLQVAGRAELLQKSTGTST